MFANTFISEHWCHLRLIESLCTAMTLPVDDDHFCKACLVCTSVCMCMLIVDNTAAILTFLGRHRASFTFRQLWVALLCSVVRQMRRELVSTANISHGRHFSTCLLMMFKTATLKHSITQYCGSPKA